MVNSNSFRRSRCGPRTRTSSSSRTSLLKLACLSRSPRQTSIGGTVLGSQESPPVAGRPQCFSDSAKRINFRPILAMALLDELTNFNIVAEKCQTRAKLAARGAAPRGSSGSGQGLHHGKGGHIQHTGCRSRRGELDLGSGCGHAGCRSGGSSRRLTVGAL
jgi:hypothetical protein